MRDFLTSNEWHWRLARTIVQGILGIAVANIDVLMGAAVLDATWSPTHVALVIAVLPPSWPSSEPVPPLRGTVRTDDR